MMLFSFLEKLFKSSHPKKEWLTQLFNNIEKVHEQELVVPFKIVEVRKGGFLVKVKGLYAFVPFNYMPWRYERLRYWKTVSASLMEKWFYGKVYHINKIPEKDMAQVYVDATPTTLKLPLLRDDIDYTGIVIQKFPQGVLVDIGPHFNWRCGAVLGILPNYYFTDRQAFWLCKPGEEVVVNYAGEDEQGLMFEKKGAINLSMKYTGKTIRVKVYKSARGIINLVAEERYQAVMPINTDVYGDQKKAVRKAMKSCQDGEIIECCVLGVNKLTHQFIVKYLSTPGYEAQKESAPPPTPAVAPVAEQDLEPQVIEPQEEEEEEEEEEVTITPDAEPDIEQQVIEPQVIEPQNKKVTIPTPKPARKPQQRAPQSKYAIEQIIDKTVYDQLVNQFEEANREEIE